MIEIIVNGEKHNVKKDINIQEMIEELGYADNSFAVALNETFISLKEYPNTKIKSKDTIDILAPMAGG